MKITTRTIGKITILSLDGQLTAGAAARTYREAATEAVQSSKGIVINLLGLTQMDSSGLGEIVRSFKSAKEHGHRLVLACVQPRVALLLRGSRLPEGLEVFDDEIDAVRALS